MTMSVCQCCNDRRAEVRLEGIAQSDLDRVAGVVLVCDRMDCYWDGCGRIKSLIRKPFVRLVALDDAEQ